MAKIIRRRLAQITDTLGNLQVYYLETDSDSVLITGKENTTLTDVVNQFDEHTHTGDEITLSEAERVVITDALKKLSTSTITKAELEMLANVTGNIQAQLNAKSASMHDHDTAYLKQGLLGANGGVVPLGSDGKIASQYLPSYVDDTIEGTVSDDLTSFTPRNETEPCIPETGKIYVDIVKNKSYRWSGSLYVGLDEGVALGETEGTAYRGDRGAVAYTHSQSAHARADATKVAASTTNGNVNINGAETKVYEHPTSTVTPSTATESPGSGKSFTVISDMAVNATGHVTGKTTKTVTLPTTVNIQSGGTQPANQVTGDLWFQDL